MYQRTKIKILEERIDLKDERLNRKDKLYLEILCDIRDNLEKLDESINRVGHEISLTIQWPRG